MAERGRGWPGVRPIVQSAEGAWRPSDWSRRCMPSTSRCRWASSASRRSSCASLRNRRASSWRRSPLLSASSHRKWRCIAMNSRQVARAAPTSAISCRRVLPMRAQTSPKLSSSRATISEFSDRPPLRAAKSRRSRSSEGKRRVKGVRCLFMTKNVAGCTATPACQGTPAWWRESIVLEQAVRWPLSGDGAGLRRQTRPGSRRSPIRRSGPGPRSCLLRTACPTTGGSGVRGR